MKGLTIGTEQVKKDKAYCTLCKDGNLWRKEPLTYMTDEFSDEYDTHICSECCTLYKIPRIKIGNLSIESNGIDITTETVDNFDLSKEVLTNENTGMFIIKLKQDTYKEVKRMWAKIVKEMESYKKLGLHNHIWIKSNPFKTSEGTFQLESCPVCNKAKMTYNGKEYVDDINKIVTFVAQQGIINSRKIEFIPEF